MPEELKQRVIISMSWMIETLKFQHQQTGIESDYSPELKEAIVVCDELIEEVEKEK